MSGAFTGLDWDTGNWPKCGKHGVSREEIEEVLRGTPSVRPNRHQAGAEARFDAVGLNSQGRYVFIVFTIREKGGNRYLRPISARYMHQREIDHYDQEKEGP